MKILVVSMLYAYGDPNRSHSYEYYNFYQVLKNMGFEVELFDYIGELNKYGRSTMNRKLLDYASSWRPDIAIFSLYTDEFEPEAVKKLRQITKTFCFFHDDSWRLDYSRYWARQFDYFSSPDLYAEIKYQEFGLMNSIYFPFGYNEEIFKKVKHIKKYDVSFVGSWHPHREWLINKIRKAGITVKVMGNGWPMGGISQEEMVEVFNCSKVNLNLSNSVAWDIRYLTSSPRGLVNSLRSPKNLEQMKARMFEISGCGSFQLTYFVEGLAKCFTIDHEIAVYTDADDLVQKIKFYLKHNALRELIAEAGYIRVKRDHTYASRFRDVFRKIGLLSD